MAVKKHQVVSYVLVQDGVPGPLNYFTGIINKYIPTAGKLVVKPEMDVDYSLALKLSFEDEAKRFCNWINTELLQSRDVMGQPISFHVEEHMYADNTPDLLQRKIDEFQKEHGLTGEEITRLLQFAVKCNEMKQV
jgi:hypothetical protein